MLSLAPKKNYKTLRRTTDKMARLCQGNLLPGTDGTRKDKIGRVKTGRMGDFQLLCQSL